MADTEPDFTPSRLGQLEDAIRAASAALPAAGGQAAGVRPSASMRPLTDARGKVDRTAVAFNVFAQLLQTDGVRAALYSLLRLTDYRYISIFRFQHGKATSAVHVDREDLRLTQADEVADTATYCCYVRDSNGAFVTADAMADDRTASHPARAVVRSYCGVPILEPGGALIGTLCHYDLQPRDPEQLDLDLLLQAAHALSAPGRVPPYPSR